MIPDTVPSTMPSQSPPTSSLAITGSSHFTEWLQAQQLSLAFTTYQTNRLCFIGSHSNGQLVLHERLFDKPMGLFTPMGDTGSAPASQHLYMGTRSQIWQLDQVLAPGEQYRGADQLYVPRTAHTTGDLNVHDLVVAHPGGEDREGTVPSSQSPPQISLHDDRLLFVNTDFSCLATLSPTDSFVPLWHPPFISRLVAEDRCHLNGLTLVDGHPTYMTACSTTDTVAGWRDTRRNGGAVIHIPTNEVIVTGLSMPHSPRWYRDQLWVLNSGTGDFGVINPTQGCFTPFTFCPGFGRGLAFWQNFAVVGLSKLRSRPFTGLIVEERLTTHGQQAQCGLAVIDLDRGEIVHWLRLEGSVEELFDVVVLPGVRQPQALGFQNDDIERLVTFPHSGGVVVIKPTVQPPEGGVSLQIAGVQQAQSGVGTLTEASALLPTEAEITLKYQRVYHLNANNIGDYDALTFPSLQERWRTRPPRGELVGISAAAGGTMVGFAVAEKLPDHQAEMISLLVLPPYRRRAIGTRLVYHLAQELVQQDCRQLQVNYQATTLTTLALEPLLHKLGWRSPQLTFLLAETTAAKIAQAPWLDRRPLPASFSLVPWSDLTVADRQALQHLNAPQSLSPFNQDPQIETLNSLGLRHRGNVVGWLLTHRVAPDTIRYSTLYVAEPFQSLGRGVSLIAEGIHRQIVSSVPYCRGAVAVDNPKMLRFVDRRLRPYLSWIGESRQSIADFRSIEYSKYCQL